MLAARDFSEHCRRRRQAVRQTMGKKKSATRKQQASQSISPSTATKTAASAPNGSGGAIHTVPSSSSSPLFSSGLNRSTSGSTLGPPEPLPPISPSPSPEPVEDDAGKRAEKIKDQGNTAFKAAKYAEAVDLYTKAIGSYSFPVWRRDSCPFP